MKDDLSVFISINKFISDSGFCSRREADKLVEQERVTINGRVAQLGDRVKPGQTVEIDGEPLKKNVKAVYIACNKPQGITSTTDLRDKTNIITFLNHPSRIFPVGRLDKDSDGLILLTNDGNIVNKILRASNNHEKEYIVITDKEITPEFIRQMSEGVPILGTRTKKCDVRQEGNKRFRITLTQGLNRQIRRMCEYLGYEVIKLTRIRIMNVTLGTLPVGHWRYLTAPEMEKMNMLMQDSSGEDLDSGTVKSGKKAVKPVKSGPETEKEKKARIRKEAYLEQREKAPAKNDSAPAKKVTSRAEKARREREMYLKAKKETEGRAEKAKSTRGKKMVDFESADFAAQSKSLEEKKNAKKSSYKSFKEKGEQKKKGKPALGKPSAGKPSSGRPAAKKQAPGKKRR